ncbi:MAG: hypothetical protein HYV96_19550 [Opitutae bacterium]|nr:hypothetical protein [Opitutae bacterium]
MTNLARSPWRCLLLVWLPLAGCSTIKLQPSAGHVILDRELAIVSNYWRPTEEDVRGLEKEMARLIGSTDSRVVGMERAKLSEYGVRYYGTVLDGRRTIVGEGTHLSQQSLEDLRQENARPGNLRLKPFGGGKLSFTVVYDAEVKRILSIEAAAPL